MQFKSTLPLLPLTPGIFLYFPMQHILRLTFERKLIIYVLIFYYGAMSHYPLILISNYSPQFSCIQGNGQIRLIQYMHVLLSYTSRCHLFCYFVITLHHVTTIVTFVQFFYFNGKNLVSCQNLCSNGLYVSYVTCIYNKVCSNLYFIGLLDSNT